MARESKRQRTRNAVIQAAAILLHERPWGEVTVADIAEQAGIVKATLHNNFPGGKSDVLELVWNRYAQLAFSDLENLPHVTFDYVLVELARNLYNNRWLVSQVYKHQADSGYAPIGDGVADGKIVQLVAVLIKDWWQQPAFYPDALVALVAHDLLAVVANADSETTWELIAQQVWENQWVQSLSDLVPQRRQDNFPGGPT